MEIELFIGFISFFLTALALVIVFLYLYAIVTPYDDYKLIFEENNTAAALGFVTISFSCCSQSVP